MIADFAIWRPKLDETVVAPGRRRLQLVLEGAGDLRQLVAAQRLRPDLEGLVLVAVHRRPAPLDDGVAVTLRRS